MNNITGRLKKIEEKFLSKDKMIISIVYGTAKKLSSVIINGTTYDVPKNVNPDVFIKEKTKNLSGVITCVEYWGEK